MINDKKVKYLESQIQRLEKENEQLKKDNQVLKLQLTSYTSDYNTATDKTKELLEEVMASKKMYDDGLVQLNQNIKTSNEIIKKLRLLESKGSRKFEKAIDKEIKKMTDDLK